MKPAADGRAPYLASRLQGLGTTVFAEMSALAERTGSINLGQGFPDRDGPAEVSEAAVERHPVRPQPVPARARGFRSCGTPSPAISAASTGSSSTPTREVLVTAGATEAITAALLGLCEVGDEVVVFEPFYDSYGAAIAMAGAQRRVVPLEPPDWSFDPERLAAAVTPRTRLILLNSPHNPTGKVFSREELEVIARCCRRPRPAGGDRRGLRAPGVRGPSRTAVHPGPEWPNAP